MALWRDEKGIRRHPLRPHLPSQTSKHASKRLVAARDVRAEAVMRELMLVAIIVRIGIWRVWTSRPAKPQVNFPWLLHLETPAGRLVYRLSAAEHDAMFAGVPEGPNDGQTCGVGDKMSRLLLLATEGW